jgi:hypothetical protein
MKYSPYLAAVLYTAFVLVLVGCTNVPTNPTPRQEMIANAIEDTLSVGLVPVLSKNPAYLTEARTVAALLGTFEGTELTAADVDVFVSRLKLAPEDVRAVTGLVNATWSTYQKRYAEQVGKSLRPDVKLFLGAVSRGITNAISAVAAQS